MAEQEGTMSKYVLRLTDALFKQAAPKDKLYKLSDGAGLYIEVQPSGSKVWRMKYRQQGGGESVLTFGRYPEVSIAKAREHILRGKGRRCNEFGAA